MSAAPVRALPRWSVAGAARVSPASMAALPGSRAWVRVKPPLPCSVASSAGSVLTRSPSCARPSVLPLSRLCPRLVSGVLALPPTLAATIVFNSETLPVLNRNTPPPLAALLKAMVELSMVTAALAYRPPPDPSA